MAPDTPNSPTPANGAVNAPPTRPCSGRPLMRPRIDVLHRHERSAVPGGAWHHGGVVQPDPGGQHHVLLADRRPQLDRRRAGTGLELHDRGGTASADQRDRDLRRATSERPISTGGRKRPTPGSPSGIKIITPDNGVSFANNPANPPTQWFDVTFNADPGKTYTLWVRLKALNNSKFNDAVWVQFSNALGERAAGLPVAIDVGPARQPGDRRERHEPEQLGLGQQRVLAESAAGRSCSRPADCRRMRMQIREDGVQIDQIVLSHVTYLNAPPGPPTNDATIVPKP